MKRSARRAQPWLRWAVLAWPFAYAPTASVLAQTWTPPLGVPAPSFGIVEQAPAVPSPWTRERAGFYYVDNTSAAASETVTYGTPAAPRRSLPSPVPAGSVVEVHGGPYAGPISLGGAGTPAAPVFYRGVGKPRIVSDRERRRRLDIEGSYVVVEGFDFVNVFPSLVGHHLVVRDNEVRDQPVAKGGCGICARGSSDTVIFRNHIHNNGDPNSAASNDVHGVQVAQGAERVWIIDNHIHHNGGDAVQINSARGPLARFIYVARNQMHEDRENAVDIKQAADVIVSQNTCYGYRPTRGRGSDGTAIVINDDNLSTRENNRIWVIFNRVRDSYNAVRAQAYGYVIGNVFHDIAGAGVVAWGRHSEHLEHNTMVRVGTGVRRWGGVPADKIDIMNTVIQEAGEFAIAVSGPAASSSTISNLVLDRPARIRWHGGRSGGFSRMPPCTGCAEADLQFANRAANDFHLESAAPFTAGAPSPVYELYRQTYGISIAYDIDGRPRPTRGPWTVGALERISKPPRATRPNR